MIADERAIEFWIELKHLIEDGSPLSLTILIVTPIRFQTPDGFSCALDMLKHGRKNTLASICVPLLTNFRILSASLRSLQCALLCLCNFSSVVCDDLTVIGYLVYF